MRHAVRAPQTFGKRVKRMCAKAAATGCANNNNTAQHLNDYAGNARFPATETMTSHNKGKKINNYNNKKTRNKKTKNAKKLHKPGRQPPGALVSRHALIV